MELQSGLKIPKEVQSMKTLANQIIQKTVNR